MADSENSRTLSIIMQRHIVANGAEPRADSALALWSKWFALHERREGLAVKQREFEILLLATAGSAPGERKAANDQISYSRAHQEELEAMHAELEAARCLWMVPARTIAGVVAKLHALIEWEDPGTSPGESPWPELRLILGDLIGIGDLNGASKAAKIA